MKRSPEHPISKPYLFTATSYHTKPHKHARDGKASRLAPHLSLFCLFNTFSLICSLTFFSFTHFGSSEFHSPNKLYRHAHVRQVKFWKGRQDFLMHCCLKEHLL